MKTFGKLIVAGAVAFAALQCLRPGIPAKPDSAPIQAPPEVVRILDKDCYSCHSDQKTPLLVRPDRPRLLAGPPRRPRPPAATSTSPLSARSPPPRKRPRSLKP
jgi:mono/diheme cytochrome c family protein